MVNHSGQFFGEEALRRTFASGCIIASRNYQFKIATTAATWALQLSLQSAEKCSWTHNELGERNV